MQINRNKRKVDLKNAIKKEKKLKTKNVLFL